MTKVDFYSIGKSTEQDQRFFACRLTEKAFNQGLKIYIHTDSEETAQEMDDLLWSFRPDSFLPHALIGIDEELTRDEEIPVFIGSGDDYDNYGARADLLINLSPDIPSFHHNFPRIAEIVPDSEEAKTNLRNHWNAYKAAGFELNHHDIQP